MIALEQIEHQVSELPRADRLRLLEHLARELRRESERETPPPGWEDDLERMARDPQIQAANAAIEREFSVANLDGLAKEETW